jgi:hypothetical protein
MPGVRNVIHEMKDMNERVRTLDSSIAATDNELKSLLEQRAMGVSVIDSETVGGECAAP